MARSKRLKTTKKTRKTTKKTVAVNQETNAVTDFADAISARKRYRFKFPKTREEFESALYTIDYERTQNGIMKGAKDAEDRMKRQYGEETRKLAFGMLEAMRKIAEINTQIATDISHAFRSLTERWK